MKRARLRHLKNQSGSAMMQALTLVVMLGLVSTAMVNYSQNSSSSMRLMARQEAVLSLGQVVAGSLRSPTLCSTIDTNLGTAGVQRSINVAGPYPMPAVPIQLESPLTRQHQPPGPPSSGLIPVANTWASSSPDPDPLADQYGVQVGQLSLIVTGPGMQAGQFRADVMADFLVRDRSGGAVPAARQKVATITLIHPGGTADYASCTVESTAQDVCEAMEGCTWDMSNPGRPCQCSPPPMAPCPTLAPNIPQYISGANADGSPICSNFNNANCLTPGGQAFGAVSQINPDGSVECVRWGQPCTGGPGTLSWTDPVTGFTCQNTYDYWIPAGAIYGIGDLDLSGDTRAGKALYGCVDSLTGPTIVAHTAASATAAGAEGTTYDPICKTPATYNWASGPWGICTGGGGPSVPGPGCWQYLRDCNVTPASGSMGGSTGSCYIHSDGPGVAPFSTPPYCGFDAEQFLLFSNYTGDFSGTPGSFCQGGFCETLDNGVSYCIGGVFECVAGPTPTPAPVVAGGYIDTPACDHFQPNSIDLPYSCGDGSRVVNFSAGNNRVTGGCHTGAGYEAMSADTSLYTYSWSGGPCDSGGGPTNNTCQVNIPIIQEDGSTSRRVVIRRISDNAVMLDHTINATWTQYQPDPPPACDPPF